MLTNFSPTFSLENFEGPLELLLYLIQKEELDICEITINQLTAQLMQTVEASGEVETSSETLSLAATLLLWKSQKLIPGEKLPEETEEDPRLEIIKSLIEYCRLKDAAKVLTVKEEEQKAHFPRATSPFCKELGSGLEEVGITDLKNLLSLMLQRSLKHPDHIIQEEEWKVSDKIEFLRELLQAQEKVCFETLFGEITSRIELVVTFLALLEMMKQHETHVVKENEKLYIRLLT